MSKSSSNSGGNPSQVKKSKAGDHLKKAMQQLPLDHGAVAAAAPKLDHHEP
jgi:hypothetical protein